MHTTNYSDISLIIKRKSQPAGAVSRPGKESEPKFHEAQVAIEAPPTEPEKPKEQQTVIQPAPPQVEILPDLPTVDEELQREGVELIDSDTIFVGSRRIDLPIPVEKVQQGLKKPLNSGWRWIAELTRYILARFHIVIKKVGSQFKLVEQN